MAEMDEDLQKILADFPLFTDSIFPTTTDSNNTADLNDSLFDPSIPMPEFRPVQTNNETQSPPFDVDKQHIEELFNYLKSGTQGSDTTMVSCDGIELDEITLMTLFSEPSATGSSPVEPKAVDNHFNAQHIINTQKQLLHDATQSRRLILFEQQATTAASPTEFSLYQSDCKPCVTAVTTDDLFAHQQQLVELKSADTKKIRVRNQPRGQFRPRTENESRTSSHYVRCEDGVKPEYPTIDLPYEWSYQTDVNIIEVALVGLDKEPHPYTLENKNSSNIYDPNALIFKQDQRNVLFFRLTDDDFRNGYKSFLIEYIKGKQDDVITKDLIRTRQLDHSMLRFTRILGLGKDNFLRDETTVQYSTVMQEAYGDVEIEHIGPRYGPMCGNEMVYAILKGRILKNDITIHVYEENANWNHQIVNFTKSGNVIYFLMPAFPFQQCERTTAYISVNYKGTPIDRYPYLYNRSLDQELAALHISNEPKQFDALDLIAETGAVPSLRKKQRAQKGARKRLT